MPGNTASVGVELAVVIEIREQYLKPDGVNKTPSAFGTKMVGSPRALWNRSPETSRYTNPKMLRERQDSLSVTKTPGGWIALKKNLLTEVLGKGRDARIVGVPLGAAQVLRLMCADLLIPVVRNNLRRV